MERTRTTEVARHVGEVVRVAGWLHAVRRLGGIAFLVVRDGWGTVQVLVEDPAALAPLDAAGALAESVVAVEGMVRASDQAPGGLEIAGPRIEVLSAVTEPLPVVIGKKALKASLASVLDHAVVANRHPERRAVFRLAAAAMSGFRRTLTDAGFTEIQTPKIVAAATESGANVFQIDYFGTPAYLAQSPQLYKQMMVGVFERVFEVGPVFRAEPHDTTRHVNEYVSLDAEMGFIRDHHDVMTVLRDVIAGMLAELAAECGAELERLGVALPVVPVEIPVVHFADAQELILARHGVDVRGEPDLSPQDERWLGEWALEAHASELLFVEGYPMAKRPFYTHPDPARPAHSNSFDLLLRGTELVTGGQRLHRHEDYVAALARAGQSPEPHAAYLEAFRFGMPPHGGFAIGLERLIMGLTGAPNLRLTTLFPRDLTRLSP